MGKNFSFYEQTGILIPGATLVFGLLFFFPEFRALFFSDGVSIGGLGLFLLISYAPGPLPPPLRRIIENWVWPGPGPPSQRGVRRKDFLLFPCPAAVLVQPLHHPPHPTL